MKLQIRNEHKDITEFLIKNGFKELTKQEYLDNYNIYGNFVLVFYDENRKCMINITDKHVEFLYNGSCVYHKHKQVLFWLIGVLTYNNIINRNYKI